MKVTLRRRNQGGKISLYLDHYHKGTRKAEYLRLYLIPKAKTKEEKITNKKTLELAESIRAQRQVEAQNETYGFHNDENAKGSFISYMRTLAQTKQGSLGTYDNWLSTIKHLDNFYPQGIAFRDIDQRFLLKFKTYLDTLQSPKTGRTIAPNTQYTYFCKMKACLKQAIKDGILTTDPSLGVDVVLS